MALESRAGRVAELAVIVDVFDDKQRRPAPARAMLAPAYPAAWPDVSARSGHRSAPRRRPATVRARWPCGTRHWQGRGGQPPHGPAPASSRRGRSRRHGRSGRPAPPARSDVAAAATGIDDRETGERLEAVEQRLRRRRQHAGNDGKPRAALLAALDDVGAQFLGLGHVLLRGSRLAFAAKGASFEARLRCARLAPQDEGSWHLQPSF